MQRVTSGIKGLDEMLGGGFPKGRVILISGGPGAGKTNLSLQFIASAADEGDPGVYVTLEETIEIAKAMWTQEKATYRGKYYCVEDALCYPHPVQKPHVPVWVGGTGYQTLKVSAKHADAINFAWSQPPEFFEEKLGVLRKQCERYGTDYDAIRKSAGLMITMEESPEELEEELQDQRDEKDTPYRRYLSRQPPNIVDTPEAVAERIGEYVGLGFDHFILRFNYGQEIEKMRLFAEKVRDRI